MYNNIKPYIQDDTVFYSLLIVLIGVVSFGLGRWSVSESVSTNSQSASVVMTQSASDVDETGRTTPSTVGEEKGVESGVQKYVASKNGSKFHLPYCPGAQQMKEENKIWFSTKAEAQAAGYTPAANCPDL